MTRSRRRILTIVVLLTLGLAVAASTARACPMCTENLPSGKDKVEGGLGDDPSVAQAPQLAEGFYYSIIVMLVAPYGLLGTGGVALYYMLRKPRGRVIA